MNVYPLKFSPIYKERIWGGRNLQRLFRRPLPPGKNIGESWELADLAEGASVASNGPLSGATLTELTGRMGGELLGTALPCDGRFPLLLKLLDANETLSLQVHPDAQAAARIGPPAALKTECWYVLESRGGFIYKGLEPGVTAGQFRRAIQDDTVERLVRRYDVVAGDFHYLPAGVVHALGRGAVVAEVQTPSDTTYRVTDWGRGREIHVERSMQCIHFDPPAPQRPCNDPGVLLETEFFTVRMRSASAGRSEPLPSGRCSALMIVSAAAPLEVRHGGPVEPVVRLGAGDTVLLPSAMREPALEAGGDCKWLEVTLPNG